MRFVKLVLISFLALFIAISGVFMLFPSQVRVSRIVQVDAPKKRVYEAIDDLRSWDKWNIFFINVPLTGKTFSAPSQRQAAFLKSDQVTVVLLSDSADRIKSFWKQGKGKNYTGGFNLVQTETNSVIVEWYFDFDIRWYPWERLGAMFLDKQLGPQMEQSLLNLKRQVENNP